MAGLIFIKTANFNETVEFYTKTLKFELWLKQPDIWILKHGNFLVGFQDSDEISMAPLMTLFYSTNEEVDEMHELLASMGLTITEPKENKTYRIYNFFAKDPEGRQLEFQKFLHELPPI